MIALVAAAGLWVAGWMFFFRLPLCRARGLSGAAPAVAAAAAAKAGGGVSVIVPARDEEATLPGLLASLAAQDARPEEVLEVIVVDDESADRTAEIARAHGAAVVVSAPLPAGWRGKTWACHQGAGRARGELLLFVDADTRLAAGGLRRLLATYRGGGWPPGVLSVVPYHEVPTWREQLSAFFNLLMVAGVGAFTILGERLRRAGLFGQLLLVDRASYRLAGGHGAVREQILENFFLAERFRAAGVPLRRCGGRHTVTMRMYPGGVGELIAGWSKAFAAGAGRTAPPLLAIIVAWIAGCLMAAGGLVRAPFAADPGGALGWLALYGLYAVQIHRLLARLGSYRPLTALLFPVPLLFFLAVFARAAGGRRGLWKGRAIAGVGDRPA